MRNFFNWVSDRQLSVRILEGLRQNIIPGLILWLVGLGLVGTYYLVESARPLFLQIITWKQDYGYGYSAFSTALFGGLLPFVFMRLTGRGGRGSLFLSGFIFVIYWAFRGIDVDAFYRLQAMIFGNGVNWQTIVCKVLVDQFVYCFFWATPVTALFYAWMDVGFSVKRLKAEKSWSEILDLILIFTVSTWMVWIPGTAIIYSLPSPLQIPLFNLTLCFFVILVSLFGNQSKDHGEEL
ncbi:MAG: hypothetical protein HOI70_05995 [Opitutae bacterium]|nr:hypothetical protein [Opitutae bacterium]